MFKRSPKTTYVGLSLMAISVVLAPVIEPAGYGVVAGALFISGMLILWTGAFNRLIARLRR